MFTSILIQSQLHTPCKCCQEFPFGAVTTNSDIMPSMYFVGSGYRLTVVQNENCLVENLLECFQKFIPEGEIKCSARGELSVGLSKENPDTIVNLLSYLEENQALLGIQDLALSESTMEEVFLK